MNSDFLLTAEELRLRRVRRRRLLIGAIVPLLVVALVVIFARPAAHAIKAWQARRHARQAFALIEAEKWSEAQREATAAYQLWPNEPEALRAVARLLSRLRQTQALEFWERLAKAQALSRDDLRDEAAVALGLGELERAASAISRLLANGGGEATPADWLLKAQLESARGAPDDSIAALRRVLENPGASSREQLQAAVLELRLATSDAGQDQRLRADAWRRIEKLGQGKDAAGLSALVLLAQRELGGNAEPETMNQGSENARQESAIRHPSSAMAIANAIASHPSAKAPQQLLAVDLRIRAAPDEKEKLIQSAVEGWKGGDNETLGALATWLNGRGEFQRELEAIPLDRALQSRDLFLQHVDALGGLGQWAEIRQLLESERFPLDPVIEQMYLARCYAQLGQQVAAGNSWQRALEKAAGDASKLMTLAEYAEKNGATKIAATACDTAIASAPRLRQAWQMKLRLAQAERDTGRIHAVLAEMLKHWPNDSAIQNDEAYLRLLLAGEEKADKLKAEKLKSDAAGGATAVSSGSASDLQSPISDLRAVEQLAKQLVQRDPASLPHRTLLALVYLKQNRPATALGVYEKLNVPPNALTPSALAVHAAVLKANGNLDDAVKEAAQVPRSALLPEEQALISDL